LRAVAILIANGTPADTFQRLADLAAPERVREVLTVLHREAGGTWTSQTLHFANALIVMARRWAKVTPETLEMLTTLRRAIRLPRNGLSQRAQETLAQLSDERVRRELFALPGRAFDQAETLLRDGRPAAGAKLAEAALVLGLFTSRPVRVGSLAVIDIAHHLRRDRQGRIIEIVIPPEHVKNRKGERIAIAPDLARRLDLHIAALRPHLPGAQLGSALFPAPKGGPREAASLTRILRSMTKKQIGVAVRAHDLRHLAVDMLLEANPDSIPVAQQLLGHSSPRVTEEIYHGRRARSAQAQYAAVVASQLGGPEETAHATRGKSRRARR
jgi:integrase